LTRYVALTSLPKDIAHRWQDTEADTCAALM
jgi:hypothetical protein